MVVKKDVTSTFFNRKALFTSSGVMEVLLECRANLPASCSYT